MMMRMKIHVPLQILLLLPEKELPPPVALFQRERKLFIRLAWHGAFDDFEPTVDWSRIITTLALLLLGMLWMTMTMMMTIRAAF